jgi:AAA+ ATPase superfamily predicted ATPase
MIGRTNELNQLENMYESDRFEFLVMYGRRRVGKTTILQEFASRHDLIFFPCQEKNDALNLLDFSRVLQRYFDGDFIAPFMTWGDAFSYITRKGGDRRIALIIDEFPFLAETNPAIKSTLQHEIDHHWSAMPIFLILCGSSVSFMIRDVMGEKSPLFGRVTGTREVLPFNFYESADFFPNYDNEDKLIAYGILGGIPRYLNAFTDSKSIKDNIAEEILRNGAFLNDEPEILLRTELREPAVYNSILEAIAGGCNTPSRIADRIHEDRSKVGKYLSTLQTIRILERWVPCGESERSRRAIYKISDNFYSFWYRYVFTNKSYYEMLGVDDSANEIMQDLSNYMGPVFEDICKQYLMLEAMKRELPFVPYSIGKWWGNNPATKKQDDVYVLALNKKGDAGIFCECKYRNKTVVMDDYDKLVLSMQAFPAVREKHMIFFSKGEYSEPVKARAKREGTLLLSIDDLFV